MSLQAIINALETEVRTAIPTLPTGAAGWEQGLRTADKLTEGEFPHVFAHSPNATIEVSERFQSYDETHSIFLDLWDNSSQTDVITKVEAITDQLRAMPDLAVPEEGLEIAWVADWFLAEVPDQARRAARIEVRFRVKV